MSVTVVSCVYGDRGYERFLSEWDYAIRHLDPRPDSAIVISDRAQTLKGAHVLVAPSCRWQHPQAYYLQLAVERARTDWVWIVDIDDQALPDALEGLEAVTADVWAVGYISEGETYVPPAWTAQEIAGSSRNVIPAGSMIRTEAFQRAGGFPDAAFQDWGLWRRLARSGATFESSTRPHYRYNRHATTRTAVELVPERRGHHLAEMFKTERDAVAA